MQLVWDTFHRIIQPATGLIPTRIAITTTTAGGRRDQIESHHNVMWSQLRHIFNLKMLCWFSEDFDFICMTTFAYVNR